MWTPRRTLMVIFGLVLFSGGFVLYSRLFGWIDGLPPLPEAYLTELTQGQSNATLVTGATQLEIRLCQAFGENCIEQTYNRKFESREKGLLFAASDWQILKDGRVQVEQMSVAMFGKTGKEITTLHCDRALLTFDQPIRKLDDLGTRKFKSAELYADPEYPTNDKRHGRIHMRNNRKTPDPDDDLILISPGPIYYVEEPPPGQPHIWTKNDIELTDRQNRPLPSQPESQDQRPTVTAIGGRVYLKSEPPTPAKKAKSQERKSSNAVNGVNRIELDRDVKMNLWTESSSFAGPDKAPPPPPNAPPAEKTLVVIQTKGPFAYDGIKDIAHFEIPPKTDQNIQEFVLVTRHTKGNSEDTLTSDQLDVQFKRDRAPAPGTSPPPKKEPPPPPKKKEGAAAADTAATPASEMEIDTVHAWGKNIAISSDQDSLYAYGVDLFYDARIKQTILKGAPMHAVKDGNLIRSPELILSNIDDKLKQNMRARGPGIVGMGDIDPKTQEYSKKATWNDWLVVTKVHEQGKDLDLITLTGNAVFLDTINDQRLIARQLKVWMLGRDDKPGANEPKKQPVKASPKKANADAKAAEDSKALPHRLEATGDVVVQSPDMKVHDCRYLNVWFKDVPPPPIPAEKTPDPRNPPTASATKAPGKLNPGEPAPIAANPKEPANPLAKKDQPGEPEKKNPPMIVRHADRIEMWVNRIEERNDLDKVHMEGNVRIHQDPSSPDDKGVDIAGNTVDLEHFVEGNYLIVTGNERLMGEVHFDKVSIIGEKIVKIDQRNNTATVNGPGIMRMLSQASLVAEPEKPKQPAPLEKPKEKYITVYWNDSMELEGAIRSVRYEGSVQAEQDDGRILCAVMQVWLDRPLYLNQMAKPKEPPQPGKKGEPDNSPKVKEVLCDQVSSKAGPKRNEPPVPVLVEDVTKENGKLVKYTGVVSAQVKMDNENSKMETIGPGKLRIWDKGKKDLAADPAVAGPKQGQAIPAKDPKKGPAYPAKDMKKGPAKKNDDDEEMKLTWVSFDYRMKASNLMPKRAIFFSDVEMVHMPSDRHDVEINLAKLPARALYLHCRESLEVTTQSRKDRDKNGKEIEVKWQEMKAIGNVTVRSDDFDGWGRIVTYSEEKSLLVFYGDVKSPAILNRTEQKGGERKTFRGVKIIYNVKTKDFSVEKSLN